MDKNIITCIIVLGIVVISIFIGGMIYDLSNNKKYVKEYQELYDRIELLEDSCSKMVSVTKYDSVECLLNTVTIVAEDLQQTCDSLEEELQIANIKLDRIKEYNRIAGQGNNIVFLRGWINRVLNN